MVDPRIVSLALKSIDSGLIIIQKAVDEINELYETKVEVSPELKLQMVHLRDVLGRVQILSRKII